MDDADGGWTASQALCSGRSVIRIRSESVMYGVISGLFSFIIWKNQNWV